MTEPVLEPALVSTSLAYAAHGVSMAKYGKTASKTVESAMRRRKKGTLESGSGRKVTSRKQAIAIGLNEAREKGGKVPAARSKRSKTTRGRKRKTSRRASA